MRTLIRGILGVASFLLLGGACWGATVSGSVNNGSGAGRIYVGLFDPNGNVTYGTSVDATAGNGTYQYTVYGVPQGTFTVGAYIDKHVPQDGVITALSPMGSISDVSVGNTDLTVDPIALQVIPGQVAQSVDATSIKAAPMDGGILLFWDNPKSAYGFNAAETYNIYWGTNSDLSPTNIVEGGTLTVPSRLDGMHQGIGGLVNGKSYYVLIESELGGTSATSSVAGPFTVGVPTGGHSITGTVNFPGFTTSCPVTIVADSENARFITTVPATSSTVGFTLPGVSAGSYHVFAFADRNANGRWDTGDLASDMYANAVTVAGTDLALAAPVVIPTRNVSSWFASQFSNSSPSPYSFAFEFEKEAKLVATMELQGPQLPRTSLVINNSGTFGLWGVPVAAPKAGDVYSATVTYADGTTETLTLPVTMVAPVAVAPAGPVGNTNTAPVFSWRTQGLPSGDYHFEVRLHYGNGNDWIGIAPATSRSIEYTGAPLTPGQSYSWDVGAVDPSGNSAYSSTQNFQVSGTAPTVTSVTPASAAQGSAVTVTGSGFSDTPSVSFNGALGTVTSVSPTSLQVTVPTVSSVGPVLVNTGDATGSTAAAFTPQITYTNQVTNNTGAAVVGAVAQVVQYPYISATSNSTGNFTLSGVPAGLAVTIKMTAAGFVPVYSHEGQYLANNTPTGSFSLHSQSQLDGWNGGATGKGAIKGRTVDNTITNMGGVVVKAFSLLHNSSTYYTVAYSNGTDNIDSNRTSTNSDGRYWVLNVEDGDTVIVTAAKANYSFSPRTFRTHAGALSEAKVIGDPLPTITGIAPLVTVPGGIITISGSHFSGISSPDSVVFSGGAWGTLQEGSSDTQLVVKVPCGATAGPVTVSLNGYSTTSSQSISFGAPTVTSIAPSAGIYGIGTQVTVTGTNFDTCLNHTQVIVNGLSTGYDFDTMTTTQLVAHLPASAQTGPITVSTPYGSPAQSPTYFVVPAPPIYYSITPDNGPVGTTVVVSGVFGDLDVTHYHVLIDGISAPIASISPTSLVSQIPAGTAAGVRTFQVQYANPTYTFGPTFGVTLPFTLTITGSGSVNSVSGVNFSCAAGNCSSNFGYGTSMQLHPSPAAGYAFNGWSGACSGTADCTVSFMNAYSGVSVGATFSQLQYILNGSTYYATLADALGNAGNASTVQAQAMTFVESPVFNRPGVWVRLKGGFDTFFGTNGGYTTIDGSFKIDNGTVRVERVKIK